MRQGKGGGESANSPEYQRQERDALSSTEQQRSPHAVLLGGQPGSGKSTLLNSVVSEYGERGGIVTIDVDRLRELIPRYRVLSRTDPVHAAGLMHEEARGFKNRLQNALIDGKRNFVLDGTMRSPEKLEKLIGHLKSAGYTVEARIVALDAQRSMTRARLRFEEGLASRGAARFVNQNQHDEAYAGLAQSVRALEKGKQVEAIRIYDASQREIYANELVNGRWLKNPAADKVLVEERTRSWTHAEHQAHVDTQARVVGFAQQRESAGRIVMGDLPEQESKLARARQALQQIEQGTTYQRAHAFDTLRSSEALGRYPELDGAYKQLQAVRDGLSGGLTPEKNQAYLQARAELSEQLHRGQLPQGPVTLEESRQVLEMAALQRRLILRDGDVLGRAVQGEVVAGSSQHVLVRISDMVALSYERGKLEREVSVGDRVVIEPGQDKHRVHEQNQAFDKDHGRDQGLGRER